MFSMTVGVLWPSYCCTAFTLAPWRISNEARNAGNHADEPLAAARPLRERPARHGAGSSNCAAVCVPRREDQSVGARWDGLQVGDQHLGDKEGPGPLHRLQEDRRIGTVAEGAEVWQVVGSAGRQRPPPEGSPPGASALQAGDYSTSPGHSSIRPQQTRWWKEQAPSRSQAGRVQPGQAQSRVPIFVCSRCMWAAHSLPAWAGAPQGRQ